jgi:hypothetical protein
MLGGTRDGHPPLGEDYPPTLLGASSLPRSLFVSTIARIQKDEVVLRLICSLGNIQK